MTDARVSADSPRDAAALRDQARLLGLLSGLERDLANAQGAFLQGVEREILVELRQTIVDAAAAHRSLAEALPAAAEAKGSVETTLSHRALYGYLQDTRAAVLDPLATTLIRLDIGNSLANRWQRYRDVTAPLAAQLPVSLRRPEPPARYRPTEQDSPAVRFRKGLVRAMRLSVRALERIVSVAGRPFGAPPKRRRTYLQQVPLRELARYHVLVRAPRAQLRLHKELQEVLALPMAWLEEGLTRWTLGVLGVEGQYDGPLEQHPEDLQALIALRPATEEREDPAPPEEPMDGPEPGTSPTILESLRERALELDHTLNAAAEALAMDEAVARGVDRLASAHQRLLDDVDRCDSFQLNPRRSRPTEGRGAEVPTDRRWGPWHRRVAARLTLARDLLRFRDGLEQAGNAVVAAFARPVLTLAEPVRRQAQEIRTSAKETDQSLRSGARAADEAVAGPLETALAGLEEGLPQAAARLGAADVLRHDSEQALRSLLELIASTRSEYEVQTLQAPQVRSVRLHVSPMVVDLQEVTSQAFDMVLMERVRGAATPVHTALESFGEAFQEAATVVRFSLGSALDELKREPSAEEGAEDPIAAGAELAVGGLSRAADLLDARLGELASTVPQAMGDALGAIDRGWRRMFDRLRVEDRVQVELMNIWDRLVRRTSRSIDWLRRGIGTQSERLQGALKATGHRVRRLVRLGRHAVGVEPVSDRETAQTLRSLSRVDQMVEALPIVYRRVFSFEPVADPDLLVGRAFDLGRMARLYEQWREGLRRSVVVTGAPGTGRTSFVNVFSETLASDAHVRYQQIRARISRESEVSALVGATLGLDGFSDLSSLGDRIRGDFGGDSTEVVVLEGVEHLLLRTVGGTDLIEGLLTLMGRTSERIAWVLTSTSEGWNLIEKTEPAAIGVATRVELAPLDRDALERLIMKRHQRSGLPLVFEGPSDVPRTRAFRRALTAEERQARLRKECFDRLGRLCEGNVTLALYYWLSSVRVDEGERALRVQMPTRLSFAFLSAFDMDRAFSLKAFLEHSTLTAPEHAAIFATTVAESLQTFETLESFLLIEPLVINSGDDDHGSLAAGPWLRYRVRPLAVQPVSQFLRARNVLY